MKSILKVCLMSFPAMTMLLPLCACSPTGSVKRSELRYNEICDVIGSEQEQQKSGVQSHDAGREPVDPAHYRDGSVEHDIAQARRHLNNVRRDYERFDCEQEHKNRHYDYPLLATALVASGAALAKANAYVLGGIGLTAGGIVAAKAYKHPDTDRDTYLEAYKELTCVYDATHVLKYNLKMDTLKVDRLALREAIAIVNTDIGKYSSDSKQTDVDKAAIKAAQTAVDAGSKALTQIDAAVSDYKKMPGAIYSTTDAIDYVARKASITEGSYSTFNASIKDAYKAAGENKANADDFKSSVAAATGAAATIDATPAAAAATSKTKHALFGISKATASLNVTFASACAPTDKNKSTGANNGTDSNAASNADASPSFTCDSVSFNKGRASDSVTGAELPASAALRDSGTSDVNKLISLATIAANDLPTPSYSEIVADVAACVPKQQ